MIFDIVTLTLKVDLHYKKLTRTVAIYTWLPPASYVVFLTTLVVIFYQIILYNILEKFISMYNFDLFSN